jgi:tRNA modification GTPase
VTTPFFDDTIAAVATPPGRGAVAMLRLSGREAGAILLSIAPSLRGSLPHARSQRLLAVRHPVSGELLDRALVTWYPGPASYTGEDTVEISCHGGVLTPQLLLDALLAGGARPARPGEFTQRAHLNGKLDLLQAEAVLDLIDGRSRALHRAAINQMDRGLSSRVDRLRSAILQVEALVVYDLDFPEEDEPPVSHAVIRSAASDARTGIDALLATAEQGELLREGALVVLAGVPNSGKSSLFNALLGAERAIVTDVPGTTRDAIEAVVEIAGYPFRLVDTAGLRDTADPVEEIGIQVAHRYLDAADLVLFCIPHYRALDDVELRFLARLDSSRRQVVRTKLDLQGTDLSAAGAPDEVAVSALSGEGLSSLSEALVSRAFSGLLAEEASGPLVTRARHARALGSARSELDQFLESLDEQVPMELAATHLRAAATFLEDLVGAVTTDDVLGHIFSQFCVGK